MSKRLLTLAGLALLALPAQAQVNPVRGIRATVNSLDPGALDTEISVTAYHRYTFEYSAEIGYYPPDYPAIDWGEGEYEPFAAIPFVATITFNGEDHGQFRGAFSHTYSAPGPFTLRVRSTDLGAGTLDQIVTGVLWDYVEGAGATPITATGESGDFVSNTAVVDFSQVPVTGRWGLAALSLLLAAGGLLLLWR